LLGKGAAQTQKEQAASALEAQKQLGSLAELEIKRTPTELDIIEQQVKIDTMIKDMDQIGVEKELSPLERQKRELEIDKLQQDLAKKQTDEDRKKITAGQEVEVLQNKVDSITSIMGTLEDFTGEITKDQKIANEAIENLVGTTGLGRTALLSRYTVKNRNLVSTIHQLTAQDTLDTLKNLKKSGATLGAISEKELNILQSAANKLNDWEVKKDGVGVGRWNAGEEEFKVELRNILESTQRLQDAARADAGTTTGFTQESADTPNAGLDSIFAQ